MEQKQEKIRCSGPNLVCEKEGTAQKDSPTKLAFFFLFFMKRVFSQLKQQQNYESNIDPGAHGAIPRTRNREKHQPTGTTWTKQREREAKGRRGETSPPPRTPEAAPRRCPWQDPAAPLAGIRRGRGGRRWRVNWWRSCCGASSGCLPA
jgi:hypothetical protein